MERNEITSFDWKLFDILCSHPIHNQETIVTTMGCSKETILARIEAKHPGQTFRAYREKKQEEFRTALFAAQWKSGVEKGNAMMLKFLGQNYLKQSDKVEHTLNPDAKIVLKYQTE